MTETVTRFDGLADAYDRWRPTYPDQFIGQVVAHFPATPAVMADVGAGTGLSTHAFAEALPMAWRVLAVEPGEDMRRVLAERFQADPRVTVVPTAGEAFPAPQGGLAAITVCTAFHWLDRARFLPHARAVLAEGGVLAVIGNRWSSQPVEAAVRTFFDREVPDLRERTRETAEQQTDLMADAAGFGPVTRIDCQTVRRLSRADFIEVALTGSRSKILVARIGRAAVVEALRARVPEETVDLAQDWTALMVRRA